VSNAVDLDAAWKVLPEEVHPGGGSPLRSWLAGPADDGPPPAGTRVLLAAAMLNILAAVIFGFLAQVTIAGSLEHNRDQATAYDDLRLALAEGTAPVGPADGKPVGLGVPIARLSIPSIGVKEVVFEGTTSGILRSGPGHRRDTVLPGQAGTSVLMGRRMAYGGPFSRIQFLTKDDEIKVVTGQGDATYKVLGVRHAGDPQPGALAPGAGRITLVTTAGSRFAGSGVDRVDADLVGTAQQAGTPALTATTLPADERALAGEPRGLLPGALWGFLLACAAVVATAMRVLWGRWQTWVVAIPVLGFLGMEVADNVARLLPNLF
jgi:sortase A